MPRANFLGLTGRCHLSQILGRSIGIFQVKGEEGMASYHRDREAKARSSEKTSRLGKDEESGVWKE